MTDQPTTTSVPATSDARTVNNLGARHAYRVLSDGEKAQVKAVKDAAQVLCDVILAAAPSRERSLAITKAQEAEMWAVRGITAPQVAK